MESSDEYLEQQKTPVVLKIGDEFDLPKGTSVLLGRADNVVNGHFVYGICELSDNLQISNFAVELIRDQSGAINISRPEFDFNSKPYRGSNEIIAINTRGEKIKVEDTYSSGVGINLTKIFVGDKEAKNGFILTIVGNDKMKLTAVNNGGEETKV